MRVELSWYPLLHILDFHVTKVSPDDLLLYELDQSNRIVPSFLKKWQTSILGYFLNLLSTRSHAARINFCEISASDS